MNITEMATRNEILTCMRLKQETSFFNQSQINRDQVKDTLKMLEANNKTIGDFVGMTIKEAGRWFDER